MEEERDSVVIPIPEMESELQHSLDLPKLEPVSYSIGSCDDENGARDIKVEGDTVIVTEVDPLSIPFPKIESEDEAVVENILSKRTKQCSAMAAKRMKSDETAIGEILFADTDSESAGASDLEVESSESEDEEVPTQEEDRPQAATSDRRSPTWGPAQGSHIEIHPFVGPAKGLKINEAPHINKASSPLSVLMLFFTQIFSLVVEQTNLYYQQHLERQARPCHILPDITFPDIMTFTALALQMGHDVKDKLHDYWSRLRQMHTPFYGETMRRDRFLHILRFLHFADNSQKPEPDGEYDRLWKIRAVFYYLNETFSKFYNPSEHLAVGEIIVKFQGRVIFHQYIPKERKRFGIKIYKLCDESGYTYDMRVYLGKDSSSASDDMTATHATVRHLTCKVEGVGHKLFMDNFFSSPRLFDDLLTRKIHSCGTVRPNRKDMPSDFGPKRLKLRRGDVRVRTRGNLTALAWKDRQDVYLLTNMDPPPEEGNFCDNRRQAVKPQIMARYNRHMGNIDISDRMANSYSMCRRNFKWTTKLFFHLLDLTVLNSWILLSSCGAKYTYRDFRLLLVRNLIEEAGRSHFLPTPSMPGRPSAAEANVLRLESRHSQHWPIKNQKDIRCRVCSQRGQRRSTVYKCAKCDVGLCVVPCFADYHTETKL